MTNESANAKAKEPRSLSEILADAEATEAWVQQMNQQIDERLEQHVQDLLFRIKILKTRIHDPNDLMKSNRHSKRLLNWKKATI